MVPQNKASQSIDLQKIKALDKEALQRALMEAHQTLVEYSDSIVQLKEDQTKLEGSRTQFSMLFEHAPVGYLVLNEQSIIIEANTEARMLLHLPQDQSVSALPKKSFLSYVVKGVVNYFDWLQTGTTEGLEVELFDTQNKGQVKLFHTAYKIKGQNYYLLTLISIAKETQLNHSLKLFKLVFEHSSEGIFITDAKFNITHVNPAFSKITGYQLEEVRGKSPAVFCAADTDSALCTEMFLELEQNGFWTGTLYNKTKQGKIYPERLNVTTVYEELEQGRIPSYHIGIFENIENQMAKEKQLQSLASTDPLTGLFNRQGFNETFENLLAEAQRQADELALLYIDLDRFKNLNDEYGHDYGDELLKAFASRLKHNLKEHDIVARLGGDEFVILLKGNLLQSTLTTLAQKLSRLLAEPYHIFDLDYTCSASIGVAIYPDHATNQEELIKAADSAMYQAKTSGRNAYQLFDHEQFSAQSAQQRQMSEIETAIQNREFHLHYQAQHDMRTGDLVGFESLARWHHSKHEIRPPSSFIPFIENNELMVKMGKRLIEQAFVHVRGWSQIGFKWPISINLAAIQLKDRQTITLLKELHERNPDITPLIHLEVTETTVFENDNLIEKTLKELKSLGFTLVLDDFGTGYSSIYSLKKFEFKIIKIDKSFVDDILTQSENSVVILNAMIRLIQELGLEIICEGVEEQAQVDYLLKKECRIAQGYFYHKPMPKNQMVRYFQKYL